MATVHLRLKSTGGLAAARTVYAQRDDGLDPGALPTRVTRFGFDPRANVGDVVAFDPNGWSNALKQLPPEVEVVLDCSITGPFRAVGNIGPELKGKTIGWSGFLSEAAATALAAQGAILIHD